MRDLGAQGRTVLVSSHILAEVEHVADTVSIIGRGELLAEGTVAGLLGASGQVRVGVAAPERASEVLRRAGFETVRDGEHLRVTTEDSEQVTRTLAEHGLYVRELTPLRPDLEATFLRLTADAGLGESGPDASTEPQPGPVAGGAA
jgi:ABC-2 type transport system ATP-binding protein